MTIHLSDVLELPTNGTNIETIETIGRILQDRHQAQDNLERLTIDMALLSSMVQDPQ